MKTNIQGLAALWPPEVWTLFGTKVGPRFKDDEWCSDANYFVPRPAVDEYNRGSDDFGFTYTVQPGNRVAQVTWRKAP